MAQSKRKTSRWFHWKALATSATFALLSYACWRGLDMTMYGNNRPLTGVLGCGFVLFGMAAVGSLGVPALVAADKRRRERATATIEVDSRRGDYTARFPTSDKVMANILASLMVLLTAFLWTRPVDWRLHWGITIVAAGIAYYAYRVTALSVRFTSNRVTVDMYPRPPYIQRYSAITGLRVTTGNVHIRFEDGRTVNIWSGMGEAEVIVKILQRKVDILPEVR